MSFDPEAYFSDKFSTIQPSKREEILKATEDKVASLKAARTAIAINTAERAEVYLKRLEDQQNAWTGRLGLDPSSGTGALINLGANAVSGAFRVAGDLVALAPGFVAGAAQAGLEEDDLPALQRYDQGVATPQDIDRINRKILPKPQGDQVGMGPEALALSGVHRLATAAAEVDPDAPTPLKLWQRMNKARDMADSVKQAADIGSIVDQRAKQGLVTDLKEGFTSPWKDVTEGAQAIMDGQVGEGLRDLASGLGELILNTASAVGNNGQGALEFAAENMPQLMVGLLGKGGTALMSGSNVGYALQTYNEGIQNYQAKNGGALPPLEQRRQMAIQSAGLVLAEQLGDVASLAAIRRAGSSASREATQGFKEALLNVGKAGAKGVAVEAPTEGIQTVLEGEITGKPASAEDIYAGAVIGGVSGGVLSGGGRAAAEVLGATPEKLGERLRKLNEAVEREDLAAKAIETGDVSAFADPESANYSPKKAIGALYGFVQRESTTPEQKQEALKKADEVIGAVDEQLEAARQDLAMQTAEGTASLLASVDAQLASATEEQKTALQQARALYQANLEALERNGDNTKEAQTLSKQIERLEARMSEAMEAHDLLSAKVRPASQEEASIEQLASPVQAREETRTADEVLTLSMSSVEALTPEKATALADDANNGLSERVRKYLRVFSESRQKENLLRSLDDVSKEILNGSRRNLGISQYRARLAQAMRSSDQAKAGKVLAGIEKFLADHNAKAAAAEQALARGPGTQIVRTKDGRWVIPTKAVKVQELRPTGGLSIRSAELVQAIRMEADTLASSVAQMRAAYELKFSSPSNAPELSTAPTEPSQPDVTNLPQGPVSVPATEERSQQQPQEAAPAGPAEVTAEGTPGTGVQPSADQPVVTNGVVDSAESTERASGSSVDTVSSSELLDQEGVSTDLSESTQVAEQRSGDEQTGGQTQSTEEVTTPSEAQDAPAQDGTLEVLKKSAANQGSVDEVRPPRGSVYRSMNKAVAWLRQKVKRVTKDTEITASRPLTAVKDFLSRWSDDQDVVDADAFFPDGLIEPEVEALRVFRSYAQKWAPIIRADFIKGSLANEKKEGRKGSTGGKMSEEWLFQDPLQELVREDGTVEENLVTAVAYGAYSWLVDALNSPEWKDKESLLEMHGLQETDVITQDGQNELSSVLGFKDSLTNSIGKRIVDALGFEVTPDAPADYLSKLTAALGAHGMVLLARENLVQLRTVERSDLERYFPDMNLKEHESRTYVELVRKDGELTDTARDIREANVGTSAVIDRLFGAEVVPGYAAWKPIPFSQAFAKRTRQKVPKSLQRRLEKAQQIPHRIIPEMWGALAAIGDQAFLTAAGLVPDDNSSLEKIQVMRRPAVVAQNDNLRKQLAGMKDLVERAQAHSPEKLEQPFFVNFEVWRNFRVGITTRDLNPQTSKIHRFSFYRPDWKTEIRLDDEKALETFKVSVAQAFGIKVDQQANAKTVAMLEAMLKSPSSKFNELARKLEGAIAEPEQAGMSDADKQAIGELAAAAEGMQTLQALVAWGRYLKAVDTQQKSVTVHMLVGVDGKTNGPILSQLALGAAYNGASLMQRLVRGGMFDGASGFTNYNRWYELPGSQDLYEDLAGRILKRVKHSDPRFAALSVITKQLTQNGKVTSSGRKIVKRPLTAFTFGSSLKKSFAGMEQNFLESVYERIEAVATGEDSKTSRESLIQAINTLIGNRKLHLPASTTIEQLMELQLSYAQTRAIQESFAKVMLKPFDTVMRAYFASFIQRRNAANKAVQGAFSLYNSVYQDLRRREIERLMDAGEVAFVIRNGKKEPLHDLSIEQERALRDKVAHLLPRAHTAHTEEGELDAGLFMAKADEHMGKDPHYDVKALLGQRFDGKRDFNTRGMQRVETSPGVAGWPYFMHSQDSHIMHTSTEDTQTLNVHDEAGNGVGKVSETARRINKATWESFLGFSGAKEAHQMFERAVLNAADMLSRGELSNDALGSIRQDLDRLVSDEYPEEPELLVLKVLQNSRINQYDADKVRLEGMSEMRSIDQYTWEGGEYLVTDEDRAKAKAQLSALLAEGYELSDEVKEAAESLGQALRDGVMTPRIQSEIEVDRSIEELDFPASPVQAMQLLESAKDDTTLDEPLRASMASILEAMATGGMRLRDAILSRLGAPEAVGLVQLLAERLDSLPEERWGQRGNPHIVSDKRLVSFFEERAEVTSRQALELLLGIYQKDTSLVNRAFNLKLLGVLNKLVDPGLKIRYVTPATDSSMVMSKADKSRGWYAASSSRAEIYVLSPDYVHSGLTPETLLHELTHAALSRAIEQADASPEAKALVDELEQLRSLASSMVASEGLSQFAAAVGDVHEFVTWGMTNQAFQAQVLNKLQFKSRNWGNQLVSGVKALVGALARLLFRDADNRKNEIASNGLGVLIGNVSGLFAYAAKIKTESQKEAESLDTVQVRAMASVASMSTVDIHQALNDGRVSPEFQNHLQTLLEGIVQTLHGPFGTFKAMLARSQAISPLNAWAQALATGEAPFASKTLASDLLVSPQEAFTIEQVEATVRAALKEKESSATFAYQELSRLYAEAERMLSPKDFHDGDWSTATADEQALAKSRYDFVFKLEFAGVDGRMEHLARFAALGLAHQQVNKLLQRPTEKVSPGAQGRTFAERLQGLFERILSFFSEQLTHTWKGQQADVKLTRLVNQLVQVEARRRHVLARRMANDSWSDKLERAGAEINTGIRSAAAKAISAPILRNSGNTFVRLASKIGTMAAKDQVDFLMDAIAEFRDKQIKGRQGVFAGIFNDVRGPKEAFQLMLRWSKTLERQRKAAITGTAQVALKAFSNGGKDLTEAEKAGVSSVLLRSGAHALLGFMNLGRLEQLLGNTAQIDAEIARLEGMLTGIGPVKHFIVNQTNALGYFKATGEVKIAHLLMNAHNIISMHGTGYSNRLDAPDVARLKPIVEALIALNSIRYSDSVKVEKVKELLRRENARQDGGNGVQMTLLLHKRMEQESLDRVFYGRPELMMHGYLPEIYNPHVELKVATENEGRDLVARGFVKGKKLWRDPGDPRSEDQHIYVLKDGGLERYQSGVLSFTARQAKGTPLHDGYMNPHTQIGLENAQSQSHVAHHRSAAIQALFQPSPRVDHSQGSQRYFAPVLNDQGKVVNWRYLMAEGVKDALLDRDNRFEMLLGALAGSVFDKQTSQEHNQEVVEALHEQFTAEFASNPDAYVLVGPKSNDPELSQLWALLPRETRDHVRSVWGQPGLYVRSDSLDILFGYRKASLAQLFDKQNRNILEKLFVELAEGILGKKAALILRKGERAWQEIVSEAKDIIVVKSGVVLLGNIWSNISLLLLQGVPVKDLAKHHLVAMKAATAYQRDTARLQEVHTLLDAGYTQGNQDALQREMLQLSDALARNPVRELIDAGLMPSIVEDVAQDDDPYSYKSLLSRKVQRYTDKLNPTILEAAKTIYMTHDTPMYQGLSRLTQLSDFVARYTLYQHLTTRKLNPLDKATAIQRASDAFVNYDIPMPKLLQYTDDMGFTMFTKYFLRIQRVLVQTMKDHPARVLGMLAMDAYTSLGPIVLEGSAVAHIGNNPLKSGAFKYLDVLDELATVKAGMSLFK